MNADLIAQLLGLIAIVIIIAFLIWRSCARKNAEKQLKEDFCKGEDKHER